MSDIVLHSLGDKIDELGAKRKSLQDQRDSIIIQINNIDLEIKKLWTGIGVYEKHFFQNSWNLKLPHKEDPSS